MYKLTTALAFVAGALPSTVFSDNKLEEVIVTSSKIEIPLRQVGTSLSVITEQEIALRGNHSLTDILRTQPGVAASNSGGAGKATSLRVRGEEGYRTLIMIDGVDITDPSGTQAGPQAQHLLTTSDIERIEILRGPQGFIYGADAGGVVNVFTRSGVGDLAGMIRAEYGRFNSETVDINVSAGNEIADIFVARTTYETEGFNARTIDQSGEKDGYDNTTNHLKTRWNLTPALTGQLVLRDVSAESAFDGCSSLQNDCLSVFDQTTAKLSFEYEAQRLLSSVGFSRTEVDRTSLSDGGSPFGAIGETAKFEYLGRFDMNNMLTWVWGGDIENEDAVTTGGERDGRDQLGLFGEAQLSIDNQWFVTAGARHDDNDDFGEHTSVRLTAAYVHDFKNTSSMKFRTSFGNGFRAPSLSEIAYNAGPGLAANTVLTEEKSEGFDVGVELHHSSGATFELSYFEQLIDEEIFFDLIAFSGYLQENGESRSDGVEFAYDIPVHTHLSIRGNITYNNTETSSKVQRARRPEYLANVSLQLSLLEENLKVLASVRASKDAVNDIFGVGRVSLDDYEVFDVSLRYRLHEKLEFYTRIENITDEDYQEVTTYNTTGAAVYSGLTLRL